MSQLQNPSLGECIFLLLLRLCLVVIGACQIIVSTFSIRNCEKNKSAIFPEQRALSISLVSGFDALSIAISSHAWLEWQQEICLWRWAYLQFEVK